MRPVPCPLYGIKSLLKHWFGRLLFESLIHFTISSQSLLVSPRDPSKNNDGVSNKTTLGATAILGPSIASH